MTQAILLQDWCSVSGSSSATITQPVDDYADLAAYQDIVVFLEVSDFNTALMSYQTSPSKDETLFQNMLAPFAMAMNVTRSVLRYSSATVPLARYFRWKLSPSAGATFFASFRIWLAANPSGVKLGRAVGRAQQGARGPTRSDMSSRQRASAQHESRNHGSSR